MQEPASGSPVGELVTDEDGEPKLFESPVAALAFARKSLEKKIQMDSPRP
jgi:hypothetical protein